MGITGLLPFLDKSSKKCNIAQFSGGTVAVDSYCWLHKGAFSCADKLVMGQPTDAYVKYCMKYVQMLLDAKIKPILVFDGRHLQAKAETEVKRREARKMNRKKGAELMRMGNNAEGRSLLRRSLDITHKMALELIKECQQFNVDCIVAPYEADAQLAYLNISGIADIVITEDSDLTLFGCKKIFFKMDLNGNGVLVEQDRLHISMGVSPEKFDMDKFRHMCILSGCDYLPSLPGIGLMKACKFISKVSDCDIQKALPRMGTYLNMKSLTVPKEYIDSFIKADVTFKHQLVYCPIKRKQVRLYPPTSQVTEDQLKFAGEEMQDEKLAWQIALGNYDPFTLDKLHDFDPDNHQNIRRTNSWAQKSNFSHTSIWSKSFSVNDRRIKEREEPLQLPNSVGKVAVLEPKISKLSGKRSSESFHVISDDELIQLYQTNMEDSKSQLTKESSDFADSESESKDQKSPIISEHRVNPFKKHLDNDSPSYLNKGRVRSILRFKPTVIDDSVVTQSKFFSGFKEVENEKQVDEGQICKKQTDATNTTEEKLKNHNDNTYSSLMIVDESHEINDVEKMQEEDKNDDSFSEAMDCTIVTENTDKRPRISSGNSDNDEYFSTEEITIKSSFFQRSNPKTMLNTNDNSCSAVKIQTQRRKSSFRRQSSGKKVTAKKTEPIAGQSLLKQYGFQRN